MKRTTYSACYQYIKNNFHLFDHIKCDCHLSRNSSRGRPYNDLAQHALRCFLYLDLLQEINPDLFNEYIEYTRENQTQFSSKFFAHFSITGKISTMTGSVNNSDSLKEFLDISKVSSPNDFPPLPGIYLVRFLNNDRWESLYLGKSENLKSRWNQHHRMPEIELLKNIGLTIEFRFLAESNFLKFSEPLELLERRLIEQIKPKLNGKKIIKIAA
jgi:hypothetical protein